MSQNPNSELLQPGCYVRQSVLLKVIPFSSATLWRKVADGSFPAPVKLGPRITAWAVKAIRQWMATVEAT